LSLSKNISFTFLSQIGNTVLAFISTILITRILGVSGRGEYAIFTNSSSFVVLFFGFSITSTIPYFINSGKAKAEDLLTTILLFVILSTLLAYIAILGLSYTGRLNIVLPDSASSNKYLLAFILLFFNTLVNSILTSYLTTFKKFKEVAILSFLAQVIPLCIYVLLYFKIMNYNKSFPIISIIDIITVVSIASLLLALFTFKKVLHIKMSGKILPWTLIRNFILFTGMAYIGNVFQFFSYKIDFWFVDAYCGKAKLGVYSLAAQLAQLLWIVPQSLSVVLGSYASKMKPEEALPYALRFKKIAFYLTLALGLVGVVVSYALVPLLFGKDFTESSKLLAIFLIGVVPFSTPVVIAIITILLYWILIPKYGVYGGALASVISYIISFVMTEYWLSHLYNVKLVDSYKINFKTLIQEIIAFKSNYLGKL
jgi:O-antigen/teichoic acid export membrane protein